MEKTIHRKLNPSAIFDENQAELGQAKMRLWHVAIGISYGLFTDLSSSLLGRTEAVYQFYAGAFSLFVFLSYLNIRNRPGNYPLRRIVNMTGDYAAFAIIMTVGEATAMPCYALILWATLGNGMRFGQRYLLIAAIMAQIVLLILVFASEYWRSQFELMLTFSVTAIALPTYALMLLRETSKARDAALEAMLAKSRFLAHASHDLRQPIHAVGYYIGALRNSPMNSNQVNLVDRIERSLGGVARLFKSLLDIAKLDSGTIDVRPERVALKPLIDELISQNKQFIDRSGVEMRTVLLDVTVDADPTLMTTMVQNLMSNAIKYSRGRKILIGVRRRGSTVSVEIYDQGVGIDSAHLPHIFEEFYRAHSEGDQDHEGVGLGLAILQRLATLCGFSISLMSTRGVGTSVRLSGIPVSQSPANIAKSVAINAIQPLAGWRVILIEDDIDVLEATAGLLKQWGCLVQAYSNLPEDVSDADVIISDFEAGGGNTGSSAIAAIRTKLARPVPAIVITGHADDGHYHNQTLGDIILLTKPVQPATLRSALSSSRVTATH